MKALVLEENAKLIYTDRALPAMDRENTVLVRVVGAGICGSDVERGFFGKAYHYPLVMGHEFSGIVEEALTPEWRRGDRVVVIPLLPCYRCASCEVGDYAQCVDYDYYGSRRDGGFMEYVAVPAANLLPVPDHIDIIHAAMTEPCAVALHGVSKLDIRVGESGLVIGAGPIGLMAAQWMRLHGCRTIYVADIDERKLAIVEQLGMYPLNSARGDLVDRIDRLTDGDGVRNVVEAVGLPRTFRQAVLCGGNKSRILFMGNIKGSLSLEERDVSRILRMEITIKGTWNSKFAPRDSNDWTTALRFMDRELHVAPLISHVLPLSRGPEIFSNIVNKTEFTNKVLYDLRKVSR
ncbi:MAG: galactitol-1-phosphate 5-dehydrogenase [Spirochaetales bacterium]|nr:galactitol-1-phosphate 5-dehydrogenase [Spirochaetales bacterium]